jgi:hypothetical protein
MTSTPANSCVELIGHTAGVVWRALDAAGPMSIAKLVKAAGQPRDTVMQAIGWLAQEDKINIEEDGRTRLVSLR